MKPDEEKELKQFMRGLKRRNKGEPNFQQAVYEVAHSVVPFILRSENSHYYEANILERMTEPDRIIQFRVTWEDDEGQIRANKAWRVQFNNSIGPYKGGIRFTKDLALDTLKFLGFEQTFKNSLTGLPMGGAKGGANFNPKGKSDREVMRFCLAMMTELHRHIGEDTDVPAGDIGVGARELGFLFGQYKRLENRFVGILTGKGLSFGGSHGRKEATGHGLVYFLINMLERADQGLAGKRVLVSGSGNVALYAIQLLNKLGAIPIAASDSGGTIYDPEGISGDKFDFLRDLKEVRRGRVSEYAEKFDCEYLSGKRPWGLAADVALPCATENELDENDAKQLIKNGVIAIAEGANMPCSLDAIQQFRHNKILFGPGKAANAGGVAVSGLEQSQNSLRIQWPLEKVDEKLKDIMRNIHDQCCQYGAEDDGHVDYVNGANIGGFIKVADAMLAYGAM